MWVSNNTPGVEPGVKNEDIVGAKPTGDAPTTSEWSTIVLPTKLRLIFDSILSVPTYLCKNKC